MSFETIDLSKLPPPNVVQPLDVESVFQELLADLQTRDPAFTALVESDTTYKILEVVAYAAVYIVRQKINDAARAVMLAFSTDSDLEHLGALLGVSRKVIDAGSPGAIHPVLPTYEADSALRARIQQSLEGFTTAGSVGAYKFHALQVATIKDVAVAGSPPEVPGTVRVTILSYNGNGAPSGGEITSVENQVSAEDVRPLTDTVIVQGATIVTMTVDATLYISEGADSSLVVDTARAALVAHLAERHKIGAGVYLSGIYAALQVGGVNRVTLAAPLADVTATATQAVYCNPTSGITLTAVIE